MSTSWTVPRTWSGETAAILASGPSMSREVAETVKGRCRVIAVNNQAIDTLDTTTGQLVPAFAPWADVLYAADAKWWHCYQDRALKFAGLKVTTAATPFKEVLSLKQSPQKVFDPRPTHLASGGNSGYQALHLAVHFGATQILLCGFDMLNSDKRRHWFGNHPARLNSRGNYATWLNFFARLAPVLREKGVRVWNCSPKSALKAFPTADLRNKLAELNDGSRALAASSGLPEASGHSERDHGHDHDHVGGSLHGRACGD